MKNWHLTVLGETSQVEIKLLLFVSELLEVAEEGMCQHAPCWTVSTIRSLCRA